jgi:hypothetical protein
MMTFSPQNTSYLKNHSPYKPTNGSIGSGSGTGGSIPSLYLSNP